MDKIRLRIARREFDTLYSHLFPGDHDEHGAILLAGVSSAASETILCVREVHIAKEGTDYIEGRIGYRALAPQFIHRLITRARDQRLAYLAVHNHGSDLEVQFSSVDFESHDRGYPALLQIAKGMPVGALVLGHRSMQADVWMPDRKRCSLSHADVVGSTIVRLRPSPLNTASAGSDASFDRQIRMFGKAGQLELAKARVAVIGLGGIGSLVLEYLARLGVGNFVLVDNDTVEESNLSRIVGASLSDASEQMPKTKVAQRVVASANPSATIEIINDDVAKASVSAKLVTCDYLFLAADSMRARLVVNALVQQYLVPGVQLGSKIRSTDDGKILDIMSANRPMRPRPGCLWCNQLIDPAQLALEAKTDEERIAQAYGVQEPNPSVISLNAISAAHAVNDFLLDYLTIRPERPPYFEHFNLVSGRQSIVSPRIDDYCPECSPLGRRYAMADSYSLPCIEG